MLNFQVCWLFNDDKLLFDDILLEDTSGANDFCSAGAKMGICSSFRDNFLRILMEYGEQIMQDFQTICPFFEKFFIPLLLRYAPPPKKKNPPISKH